MDLAEVVNSKENKKAQNLQKEDEVKKAVEAALEEFYKSECKECNWLV